MHLNMSLIMDAVHRKISIALIFKAKLYKQNYLDLLLTVRFYARSVDW